MTSNISVMGIYTDRETLSDAINVLHRAGYRPTDISVLSSDNQGSKDFAMEQRTKMLEGAAMGTAVGAGLGAILGWLISARVIAIAGLEPLVAAGPVWAVFACAGGAGALGWLLGLLAGMRQTEYVAKRYAGRIRHGGILASVHCDSPEWCERAKETLKNTGARHISSASEARADFGTTNKPTERAPAVIMERVVEAPSPQAAEVAQEVKERL